MVFAEIIDERGIQLRKVTKSLKGWAGIIPIGKTVVNVDFE
jgi:hypothetical protein